jgi:hypothetical protein
MSEKYLYQRKRFLKLAKESEQSANVWRRVFMGICLLSWTFATLIFFASSLGDEFPWFPIFIVSIFIVTGRNARKEADAEFSNYMEIRQMALKHADECEV